MSPRPAQSALARVAPVARALDHILQALAISAVSIEPLSPDRLPGKRSCKRRRHFWRSETAAPTPSRARRVICYR